MRKIYLVVKQFMNKLKQDNLGAYAASSAFFIFLSMVPILITICSLLPYTYLSEAELMRLITNIAPDNVDAMAISLVGQIYDSSTGTLSVAVVVAIWSAGRGMLSLMNGLNAVNGVVEYRNYIYQRLVGSFYTVLLLVITIVTLGLSVLGNQILNAIERHLPFLFQFSEKLMSFRFVVVWLILTVAFSLIYTYLPNKKLKLIYELPGAAFAAVVWNLFSFFFSIYIDYFSTFSAYGTLGAVMALMLWMYFCIYILLLGANVNRYFKPAIVFLLQKKFNI